MMINYNHTVFVFLLLSLGIFKLGSCSENNVTVKCIKSEREALLKFKEGIIDFPGKLSSWVGEDCCQWNGVDCDSESGHVTKLNLSNPAGRPRHFDYYEGYQYYPTKSLAYQSVTGSRNRPVCAAAAACSAGLPSRNPYDRRSKYAQLLGKITFTLIPELFGMLKNWMYLNLSYICIFFRGC